MLKKVYLQFFKKVLVVTCIIAACWTFFSSKLGLFSHQIIDIVPSDLSRDGKVNINLHMEASHKFPGNFNLIEEASWFTGALKRPPKVCSSDVMNSERLQQDHPCVLNNIRSNFLEAPASLSQPLTLDYPEILDPSDGQTEAVLHLLNNKTNGFFVECGALDGENLSNTLYLERYLNWTGLLIEADREVFKTLLSKKRKSWALPVCLSDDPYPQEVNFQGTYALGQVINDKLPARNLSGQTGGYGRQSKVQCFPIYSILLAIGRTQIDYFSLDVERHELYVLKTIPFHKLDIAVLSVEAIRTTDQQLATYREMVDYMKQIGYESLHVKKMKDDVVFVKSDVLRKTRLQIQGLFS